MASICQWRGLVTPAKRGKALKDGRNPTEHDVPMTWVQRLKRVFNIEVETCGRCGGPLKVIACIEDQDIIDRVLLTYPIKSWPPQP
jgi:hypothetical protein